MEIERKIDELGRIVIPIDCRKRLGLTKNDTVTLVVQGKELIVKKKKEEHR